MKTFPIGDSGSHGPAYYQWCRKMHYSHSDLRAQKREKIVSPSFYCIKTHSMTLSSLCTEFYLCVSQHLGHSNTYLIVGQTEIWAFPMVCLQMHRILVVGSCCEVAVSLTPVEFWLIASSMSFLKQPSLLQCKHGLPSNPITALIMRDNNETLDWRPGKFHWTVVSLVHSFPLADIFGCSTFKIRLTNILNIHGYYQTYISNKVPQIIPTQRTIHLKYQQPQEINQLVVLCPP